MKFSNVPVAQKTAIISTLQAYLMGFNSSDMKLESDGSISFTTPYGLAVVSKSGSVKLT